MNKETLTILINQRLSQRQIAQKLKVSQSSIRYWLKKLNLKSSAKSSYTNCILCNKDTKRGRRWCTGCCTKIRRVRQKQAAVTYKGGKCNRCGFNKHISALEFHHHKDKLFNIGMVANKSWDIIKKELDKCELLCSNCHKAEHSTQMEQAILEEVKIYRGRNLAL
jgi:hypothetical protein